MEENIKEVVYSSSFFTDLKTNYLYGKETFGIRMADFFKKMYYTLLTAYPICTIFIRNVDTLKLNHKFIEILYLENISSFTASDLKELKF